jgi:hypothetical protein
MSIGAIQDNLVKTSLVQQTQSKGDDVLRGQEIGQVASQKEHDRQQDQVVLQLRQKEEHGIRRDEERDKEGEKKRRQDEQDEGDKKKPKDDEPEEESGARARMRTINIIV